MLTHDASMDFAASKGKSMILNRISSAMVVPLLHEQEKEVLGVVWLDSESLAQFQPKDLEVITSVAGQAAMFIENTMLGEEGRAGDRPPRTLHAARRPERRRADDQRQARGEAGRAARSGAARSSTATSAASRR